MAGSALHGVNLTGWLSLEPWVTPELFAESGSLDEDSLVDALGERRYADVVRRHRETFITKEDFDRIASRGFNAVRLPVPWYAFGEAGPDPASFVGCVEMIDQALDWAEDIDLKVVFVLAINPGNFTGGATRKSDLSDFAQARKTALDVIYALCKRYASRLGFFGIEIADEVGVARRRGFSMTEGMPQHQLRNYYREAYELIRAAAGPEPVVIMPDGGYPAGLNKFMAQRHYQNVWLDVHLDKSRTKIDVSAPSGVRRLVAEEARYIKSAQNSGMPVMVGKWSASLPMADSAMTPEGRIALERVYTSEQLVSYEKCPAWFFNTWKTSELLPGWDARVALASFERGLIA